MPVNSKADRKMSLSSYYQRNRDSLRAKARVRMAATRAQKALTQTPEEQAAAKANICSSQAKYHENNRSALRHKEDLRRERKKLISLGFFDSPDNDDRYSEYEYSSDASDSTSGSDEEDWKAETEVFRNLRARADAEAQNVYTHAYAKKWLSGVSVSQLLKKKTVASPSVDINREAMQDITNAFV